MAIEAPVHSNEANFARVLNAGLPVLAVFWRRNCPHCEQLNPVLDRLAKAYAGKALVVKVNAEEEAGLVRKYGITQYPGLVLFGGGKEVARGAGAAAERDLAAWLDHLDGRGPRPAPPTGPSTPHAAGSPPAPQEGAGRAPTARSAAANSKEPFVFTDANFEQMIRTSTVPILVDFWAVWCGPCKMVAPHVAALADEFAGRALVGKLNVDENPRTAGQYGIMGIPTLLIFSGGKVVDQIVGAQPAAVLRQRLARHVREA